MSDALGEKPAPFGAPEETATPGEAGGYFETGRPRLGGLREHFAVLQASDTVERPKPAPDMYAAAARALGADPARTLAFEDSGTGAQAARDAGMRLIVVPADGRDAPQADLALTTLTDPDLLAWIDTW